MSNGNINQNMYAYQIQILLIRFQNSLYSHLDWFFTGAELRYSESNFLTSFRLVNFFLQGVSEFWVTVYLMISYSRNEILLVIVILWNTLILSDTLWICTRISAYAKERLCRKPTVANATKLFQRRTWCNSIWYQYPCKSCQNDTNDNIGLF